MVVNSVARVVFAYLKPREVKVDWKKAENDYYVKYPEGRDMEEFNENIIMNCVKSRERRVLIVFSIASIVYDDVEDLDLDEIKRPIDQESLHKFVEMVNGWITSDHRVRPEDFSWKVSAYFS